MNGTPIVVYVTGRIYRPLESMLRQFVSGLAQVGQPARVEATQEHVPMLLEAYAAQGRLDRVALYVPGLRNRSLANSFHRGAEIDVMLRDAGALGASLVYCGDLTAAEKAMLDVGATDRNSLGALKGERSLPVSRPYGVDAGLLVVVASSYTDDWRQIVAGADLAEAAIAAGILTFWLTTAREAPRLEGCEGSGVWEATCLRGTGMFAWKMALQVAPALEVQHV